MFRQQCFGNFGTKVAQIYTQRIAAFLFNIFQRLYHVDFAFNDTDGAFINVCHIIFCLISLHQRFSSIDGKAFREAVTAYSHKT